MLEYLAKEGGLALLDADPGLIIWTFIVFGIVLLILWRFAWNPIAQALDERARKIHDDIGRAETLREEAEAKLNEYMEKLNGLRAEGQEIVAEARKDAEHLKQDILADARTEAEAVKERAMREVRLARDQALEDIHQQVTEISISVASQILERNLNEKDQSKMIREMIDQVKGLN